MPIKTKTIIVVTCIPLLLGTPLAVVFVVVSATGAGASV